MLAMQKHLQTYGNIFGFSISKSTFVILSDFDMVRELFKSDLLAGRPAFKPFNDTRPGHDFPGLVGTPGIALSEGRYWRDQRRFALRQLRGLGFGKSSMEEIL